ncbi:MAG: DUF2007 domain-containing protein [Chloroflexi bacterium]|nr:DUF2007 domain-containing protein [Chloroflexota bacterium]
MANVKWVVVATAPDQITAESWRDLLVDANVPAHLQPGDTSSFLGVSGLPCRVMVPETLLQEAQDILNENLEGQEMGNG